MLLAPGVSTRDTGLKRGVSLACISATLSWRCACAAAVAKRGGFLGPYVQFADDEENENGDRHFRTSPAPPPRK